MDYAYRRSWCANDGNQLEIPAGTERMCFALDFPPAGRLSHLVVSQISGTSIAFQVNLYDRQSCMEAESSESEAGCPAEIGQIIPTQAAIANGVVSMRSDAGGYPYRNREGSFSVAVRKLYLEIVLDNAVGDATEWEVGLGALVP